MSHYPINMMQGIAAEPRVNLVEIGNKGGTTAAAGALGLNVVNTAWPAPAERGEPLAGASYTGIVTASQAQSALDDLFDALPSAPPARPTLGQFLTLDVATLSLMVNGLMQNICNKNADSICQQIQRASEVQDVLRARQLKDYQAQINKTAEQAEKVRKAGIISAVCDWIVSGLQLVMGTLRVMAGDVVGGMATIMNGVAGVIKASAETALLCGADKETCEKVILIATLLQTVFGAMSMMGSMASAGNIKDAGQAVGGSKFFTYLRIANNGVEGANQTQQSVTSMTLADLQKQIEELMANQSFTDGVQKWIEARKTTQYQQLQDTFQDSMQSRKSALHTIDNYGSALAHVVGGRA